MEDEILPDSLDIHNNIGNDKVIEAELPSKKQMNDNQIKMAPEKLLKWASKPNVHTALHYELYSHHYASL